MEKLRGKSKVDFDKTKAEEELEKAKAKAEELEKAKADELRAAAMAYFKNGSAYQKLQAEQFFKTIDINGDGRVSIHEYINFLRQNDGLGWVPQETFHRLDRNRDGELEFEEIMTLYYVAKTRVIVCGSCEKPQHGLYFTCVTCYDSSNPETFDLCTECYGAKYVHKIGEIVHPFFLDNYALLKYKRPVIQQQRYQQQQYQQQQRYQQQQYQQQQRYQQKQRYQQQQHVYYHNHQHIVVQQQQPSTVRWGDALHAMEAALAVGNYLGFCNIM